MGYLPKITQNAEGNRFELRPTLEPGLRDYTTLPASVFADALTRACLHLAQKRGKPQGPEKEPPSPQLPTVLAVPRRQETAKPLCP